MKARNQSLNISIKRDMINTGNFESICKRRTHKVQERQQEQPTPVAPKIGMTKKGCVMVGLPVKGVSNGSVGS